MYFVDWAGQVFGPYHRLSVKRATHQDGSPMSVPMMAFCPPGSEDTMSM
jgi:hypothetical protein